MTELMYQTAPYPKILAALVEELRYRPGWRFALQEEDRDQGSKGLTFSVVALGYNSYHVDRGEVYRVKHDFPVPPAAFNAQSWRRWLLDCLIKVETHEACEFFMIDGDRPYAPHHGPGHDPYVVFELGTDEEARTSFRGEVKDHGPCRDCGQPFDAEIHRWWGRPDRGAWALPEGHPFVKESGA